MRSERVKCTVCGRFEDVGYVSTVNQNGGVACRHCQDYGAKMSAKGTPCTCAACGKPVLHSDYTNMCDCREPQFTLSGRGSK